MATRLKEVDAVMVGMGWTGAILARELTKAGLTVIGLERGGNRAPDQDFAIPVIRDELRYYQRLEHMQDAAQETLTIRHSPSETALPIRRLGAFLPGDGVGGAGVHWGGQHWRFLPSDHELRSHLTARYGKDAIPAEMMIQDWGVSYAELEPFYDRFDKLCGVSGKAGNLNGEKIAGGNVFEGPRSDEYPTPPLKQTLTGAMFEKTTQELGYHPFPMPASNCSVPYTNPEGMMLGACQYCGHCDRFGCEANAKATANITLMPVLMQDPRFSLRTRAYECRALPVDAQYRRHHHGQRSQEQRGEPLSPVLGRGQSLRHGGLGVSAECRLQPDRGGRCPRLLVGPCDHDAVPEEAGTSRAGVMLAPAGRCYWPGQRVTRPVSRPKRSRARPTVWSTMSSMVAGRA
jgi:choline dehydrogenase-like flavoprotein